MGTGSFPGVKRPGRGADHPPPSRAEVKERVELYLCSPSGLSLPVRGCTLPLCPFLCLYIRWRVSARLPLAAVKFGIRTVYENVSSIGQKCLSGTLHEYLSTSYCCWRHIRHNSIVVQHYFCTFGGDMKRHSVCSTRFCISITTMDTRTCHSVTLYVLCRLPCSFICTCMKRRSGWHVWHWKCTKKVRDTLHTLAWVIYKGFLNWIVQCVDMCVCVHYAEEKWLVGWLVGCWSDRASNLGSSFLVAAGLLYVHDCKSQEHNTVIYKCWNYFYRLYVKECQEVLVP